MKKTLTNDAIERLHTEYIDANEELLLAVHRLAPPEGSSIDLDDVLRLQLRCVKIVQAIVDAKGG